MIGEAIIVGFGAFAIGMVYYLIDTARHSTELKIVVLLRERLPASLFQNEIEVAPMNWPASAITINDCKEIPQYRPTREYREQGFAGSWLARHKETGEVIRVIGWRSGYRHRLSDDAIIKDTLARVHYANEFERIYEPGDYKMLK